MERSALAIVVELFGKSKVLDLQVILKHRVTEECLPVFNVNGTMRKTQKSKLIKIMHISILPVLNKYTAIVIDMCLIWRFTSPTKENREKQD